MVATGRWPTEAGVAEEAISLALVFATASTETIDAQIANANKDLLKYKTIPFIKSLKILRDL